MRASAQGPKEHSCKGNVECDTLFNPHRANSTLDQLQLAHIIAEARRNPTYNNKAKGIKAFNLQAR